MSGDGRVPHISLSRYGPSRKARPHPPIPAETPNLSAGLDFKVRDETPDSDCVFVLRKCEVFWVVGQFDKVQHHRGLRQSRHQCDVVVNYRVEAL